MLTRGIDAGTRREFSQDELDALHENQSTSATLNAARRNAGQKGGDVEVRGDDETLDHEIEHHRTHLHVGKMIGTAIEGIEIGAVVGNLGKLGAAGHIAEAALHSKPGVIALGVGTLAAIHLAMWEMEKDKDNLRDTATRDVRSRRNVDVARPADGVRE